MSFTVIPVKTGIQNRAEIPPMAGGYDVNSVRLFRNYGFDRRRM